MSAVSAQININNSLVVVLEKSALETMNGLIANLSIMIILSVGLNNFWNFYLSD